MQRRARGKKTQQTRGREAESQPDWQDDRSYGEKSQKESRAEGRARKSKSKREHKSKRDEERNGGSPWRDIRSDCDSFSWEAGKIRRDAIFRFDRRDITASITSDGESSINSRDRDRGKKRYPTNLLCAHRRSSSCWARHSFMRRNQFAVCLTACLTHSPSSDTRWSAPASACDRIRHGGCLACLSLGLGPAGAGLGRVSLGMTGLADPSSPFISPSINHGCVTLFWWAG